MADIKLNSTSIELEEITGTEGEKAFDIGALRNSTGYVTLDSRFKNFRTDASFTQEKIKANLSKWRIEVKFGTQQD